MAFLACCATLYPYRRGGVHSAKVVKDTVWTFDQLQGIYTPSVPLRMTVVKLKQRVFSSIAGRSDSRVYPPCQGVSEHMSSTSSCQQPLAWNTRSSSVPSPEAFERAGLLLKPVELSINLPLSWLSFRETDSGAPRIALMPLCLGV